MRAAGLDFERKTFSTFNLPDPDSPGPDEALVRVRQVGICGTDRELARFAIGSPPQGESRLALGHEALGEVIECGSASGLKRGDWVVPAVRRSCSPPCPSCARGRRDLCQTGAALERGIFGLHGYMADYALDCAADLFLVPPDLAEVAVLAEPLSVVEKAVGRALAMHPGEPTRGLALGAGPIGLLAALVMRIRGLEAAVYSLEPEDHPRARLARDAGLRYATRIEPSSADVVVEATGAAEAAFKGIQALDALGVMCILGSPNAAGEMPFIDMLVKNQAVFGSVNAGPEHYRQAIADLRRIDRRTLQKMIRRARFDDFAATLAEPAAAAKMVHEIS